MSLARIQKAFQPMGYPVWGCTRCGHTLGRKLASEKITPVCPWCGPKNPPTVSEFFCEEKFWQYLRQDKSTTTPH